MSLEAPAEVDFDPTLAQPLPPEMWPNVDDLVTEDDTPVDNLFSEKQFRLLVESLYNSWRGPSADIKWIAMANVGMFYSIQEPPYVPDVLISLGVEFPKNINLKQHRSYFFWLYGKPPDVIVEIVSNKRGGEDTDKLDGYARLKIPYYVIYDPFLFLGEEPLRAFKLSGLEYQPMERPVWLPGVNVGLRQWQGLYEDMEADWLRWVDQNGLFLPTGAESMKQEKGRADEAEERADSAEERADSAEERAAKLAEQLRKLGVDPEA